MKHNKLIYIAFLVLLSQSVFSQNLANLLPIAPFMRVAEVSGGGLIKGLNMESIVFSAQGKTNDDIRGYYALLWKGKIKTVEGSDWFYHTNFNGKYLTVVQVRKSDSGSSGVSGIVSISEPGKNTNQSEKPLVETFYPLTPGAKILTDLSAMDRGENSRTTVIDIPGGVSSNLRFYQSYFERKGWKEVRKDMAQEMLSVYGSASLVMLKRGDELVISFIPDEAGRTKVVGVYVDK